MNKNFLLAAGAGLAIAGCTQTGIMAVPGCATYRVELEQCEGSGHSPIVTINLDDMSANPSYVCANRSRTIIFNIEPEPERDGTVAIVPKRAEDTWLLGTNSQNRSRIHVKVPGWVDRDSDHEYAFVTADGGCVDPRVRVR